MVEGATNDIPLSIRTDREASLSSRVHGWAVERESGESQSGLTARSRHKDTQHWVKDAETRSETR